MTAREGRLLENKDVKNNHLRTGETGARKKGPTEVIDVMSAE